MTVYVSQDDGRFDLSDAHRYGTICVVFKRDVYADDAEEQMPSIMKRAYDVLSDFNPVEDYMCLVGSPIYTAVCSYVLGDCQLSPVRLLRYDRMHGGYYAITIQ